MNARTVAAASVLLVTVLPSVSHAAAPKKPQTVCNLVKDDLDDTTLAPTLASKTLDIKGGDIATDGKKITAVIRLNDWADDDQSAPLGRTYKIQFNGKGAETYAFLSYILTPTGAAFTYGYYDKETGIDTGNGAAVGRIDPVKNEIRITTTIANLVVTKAGSRTGSFKNGVSLTDLRVVTGRWIGAYVNTELYGGNTHFADDADGQKSYVAGTKSCVKVG